MQCKFLHPTPLPLTPQVRLKARGVERTCYKWAVQVFSGEPKKSKGLIGGEPSSSSSCNRLEGRENLRTDYKCSWGERNGCCLSSPRSSPHGSRRHTDINIETFAAEYLILEPGQ